MNKLMYICNIQNKKMFREAYSTLIEWKNETKRKPLLFRGARQIGKSYLVKQLGENEFDNYILINFEKTPELIKLFNTFDPYKIVEQN